MKKFFGLVLAIVLLFGAETVINQKSAKAAEEQEVYSIVEVKGEVTTNNTITIQARPPIGG